jgi:hypothetical protein
MTQLGDVLPCVEAFGNDIVKQVEAAARVVWALRECLFSIVEEYDIPDPDDGDPEG